MRCAQKVMPFHGSFSHILIACLYTELTYRYIYFRRISRMRVARQSQLHLDSRTLPRTEELRIRKNVVMIRMHA